MCVLVKCTLPGRANMCKCITGYTFLRPWEELFNQVKGRLAKSASAVCISILHR